MGTGSLEPTNALHSSCQLDKNMKATCNGASRSSGRLRKLGGGGLDFLRHQLQLECEGLVSGQSLQCYPAHCNVPAAADRSIYTPLEWIVESLRCSSHTSATPALGSLLASLPRRCWAVFH